jgi:hypothetical protein
MERPRERRALGRDPRLRRSDPMRRANAGSAIQGERVKDYAQNLS